MGKKGTKSEDTTSAMLRNVLAAAAHVRHRMDEACQEHGITSAQYFVLRILQEGPPEGYPRREILERMIERSPDCTRLIDRLLTQGLAQRNRAASDRRLSLTQITPTGLKLLDSMAVSMRNLEAGIGRGIPPAERLRLSRVLEQLTGSATRGSKR